MKTAFITGITGQDGAYLTSFLLDKGYHVQGLVPRCEVDNTQRLKPIINNPDLKLHYGDMADDSSLFRLISLTKPDEVYNLAAQSHVGVSFDTPIHTANINALGVNRILEVIKQINPSIRFYQASSSEIFGNAEAPQNETTPMNPCSPYAIAKLHAYHTVKLYRNAFGLHASNGILFNHESPERGEDFVTRKVTKAVARIASGDQVCLQLGNLNAARDWGHARDFVKGMWMMLQQDKPDDYVLATGNTYSVRYLVEVAFRAIGRNIEWQGQGVNEIGIDASTSQTLVKVDPELYRPSELHSLCGDSTKAKELLGWRAETSFEDLIIEMVMSDCGDDYKKKAIHYAA